MAFRKGFFLKTLSVCLLVGFSFFPINELSAQIPVATWTCPMHPEIHASKPGSCPKCGMDLIKEKPKKPKPKPKPALPTEVPTKADEKSEKSGETSPAAEPMPAHEHHAPVAMPTDSAEALILEKNKPAPEPQKTEPLTAAQRETSNLKSKTSPPRTVRYDLYVSEGIVNFTDKNRRAMLINGTIPAPTLEFTEGDTAEIWVHNLMPVETSIHWHGLILPNRYDGVPYLTTAPIKAGEKHLFHFPLVQSGTYWYHSHTRLQEQRGMYGAFVIKKRAGDTSRRALDSLPEITLVLSDWTDERPRQVHRSLHNATDWYAIRKGATQDYGAALAKGFFKTKLTNEWKRQLPMDVSDVYYDRFLVNGQPVARAENFKKGDRVRLRVVNGSSSSYFWLGWAGGKMTVIASDGMDVEPIEIDRMIIAVAETWDVVVTLPEEGAFEFRATAEDRTGSASMFFGKGKVAIAPPLPRLKYFAGMKMMNGMMNMDGSMDDMGMAMSLQQMDMNSVMYPEQTGAENDKMNGMDHAAMLPDGFTTLNYAMLRATQSTSLPDAPAKFLKFELTGNMTRYVWTLDNKTVSESDKILIKQGENVRIVLTNNSMMRHPMHLHGHFFRVVNGQGDRSPLKNVLDIMPMETDTIEFAANEASGGDWFFHCHILYHMMAGMGRIFSYENSPPNPELPDPKKALRKLYREDRQFHSMAQIGLESNGSDGEIMFSNTRWFAQTEWRLGLHDWHGYESESHVGRYIGRNQFFQPYLGWDWRYRTGQAGEANLFGQKNTKDNRRVACAGLRYTLPMWLVLDARVDHTGQARFTLMREDIALTSRFRANFMVNTDREWMAGGRWILTKYWSLSTHYDSDMGFGVGMTLTY